MPPNLTRAQVARLDELKFRVGHALQNFASCRRVEREYMDYNDSLRFLRDAVRGKFPAEGTRRRIHPIIEIGISIKLEQRGLRSGGSAEDVAAILPEFAKAVPIKRGRPGDTTLNHTVQGLMVAWRWATGRACTAKLKDGNDKYTPVSTSRGSDLIVRLIQEADARATSYTILRAIYESRKAVEGKIFSDYFPLYGARVAPDSGAPILGPGMKLEKFIPAHPIYCSVGTAR